MFCLSKSCIQQYKNTLEQNKKLVIVTAKESWVNDYVLDFLELLINGNAVRWVYEPFESMTGDICFYLGYDKIVSKEVRKGFAFNLVVHESNLPQGRGWSPLSWQILDGKNEICITLLDAADDVDSEV